MIVTYFYIFFKFTEEVLNRAAGIAFRVNSWRERLNIPDMVFFAGQLFEKLSFCEKFDSCYLQTITTISYVLLNKILNARFQE